MKGKKQIARILIAAMLAYRIPAWTVAASMMDRAADGGNGGSGYETATWSQTDPFSRASSSEADEKEAEKPKKTYTNGMRATASNAAAATPANAAAFNLDRSFGADGVYQLEAEDSTIASYDNVNSNSEGNRVELQKYGSVTFDLSKIADFKEGKYLIYINVNGSSSQIKISVNNTDKGIIEKDGNLGWGANDLEEYSYCWVELRPGDQLKIAENADNYAHLDWVKLICLEADYWIEAEDTLITSYEANTQIHGDGDRVEVNGGGGITFDLSQVNGFQSGMYELYAGVNGARTNWGVSVDGRGTNSMTASGSGKFQKGTCTDVSLGTEVELLADSKIKLFDMDGSWGHVDYIRLIRTGDVQPRPEGVYQLEAEDGTIASYDNVTQNSEGNRVELQNNGSVVFDLSKVMDFQAGRYLLSIHMNGSTKKVKVQVNGDERKEITKANVGFGYSDLEEYYSHDVLELTGTETVAIIEGEGNQYGHLDWIKLVRVDTCYWVEAEKEAGATLYVGNVQTHEDGDRAEVNGGGSVTFDLSKATGFQSGIYRLYAGVNGARTRWGVTADGKEIGNMTAPGGGRFETGTCVDVCFEAEIELAKASLIQFSDIDGSWGHIDYIRLIRTGDATPRFDETHEPTGIRVTAPEGFFPDGTAIAIDPISRSVRQAIREEFKETDQKVFFYRFHLQTPSARRSRSKSQEEEEKQIVDRDGEAVGYLPIPEGYSGDSEVYFAQDPEDRPELMAGTWLEGRKICFQLEANEEGVYGGVYLIVDQNIWKFEGEEYYGKTTDQGAAADLQPLEEIHIPIPDDEAFESGFYNLLLRVCGGQSYTILVDGKETAVIARNGTDWGNYEICAPTEALKLSKGQTIAIRADDQYGWVDYIALQPGKPFEEESEGVTVKAEAGVVPAGVELYVEPADETVLQAVRELFGFTEENAPAMSFYTISLLMDGITVQPSGVLKIRIPIPDSFLSGGMGRSAKAGFSEENLSLIQIKEDGKKIKQPFKLIEDGQYVEFETRELGLYGLLNQPSDNELYYPAIGYYDRTTGENGRYADLQPEDALTIPVKDLAGFAEGNYILSLRSSGPRTKLIVFINGVPVGMISRSQTDWEEMNEAELSLALSLKQEDVITIYAPGLADFGPYGWVDYMKLRETNKAVDETPAARTKITLEAEDFYPDELEAGGEAANVNHPRKKVMFPILASDGFEENDYHFTLYTTGTMRSWVVCVNGVQVLSETREGSGYEMKYMTKEIGSELVHLKPGDILTVEFLEQDTDNYGNWVDKIVLNSRRRVSGETFLNRNGGRILLELAGDFESGGQPHTSVEDGNLIFQGEAYYKAQNDNPAADLQPGEQILIPVSDHSRFAEGSYQLSIRSCGNREFFRIKVNGWTVGNITRRETGYGMGEMTDDMLVTPIDLKPGDILAVEGQTGGKFGWVDFVTLTRVQSQEAVKARNAGKNYTWEGEDYYQKQNDNPAADLQPGEEIVISLSDNPEFEAGTYYLAVVSNGNRTAMVIKRNGERMGSITRNETNFDMGSMTLDVLQRPVVLSRDDVISICVPGDESGPFGWVDRMVLMPVTEPEPQKLEEYRYPAWAYGTASLYLSAADLQPGEALRIPLADHPSFTEGQYRIAMISNGTRERFDILVNGQPAGSIFRKPSDYGDNGMSSDKLEKILYLKPSDVITVVGQDGDFFGWVSALVLETAE